MNEVERKIRVYTKENKSRWDQEIEHAENIVNAINETAEVNVINASSETQIIQRSEISNFMSKLQQDNRTNNEIQILTENLQEAQSERCDVTMSTERGSNLKRRRKFQTDKHDKAERYQAGSKVWTKIHRRSNAGR